ncbi:hypothetical protein SDC9_94488 [bioreactor metagenome]|uniref:Uncharacterized protein n=1 Tax=bioreactor metagenome TaxID=1076179 RepID=A0A645A3Z1_9ZZZZ
MVQSIPAALQHQHIKGNTGFLRRAAQVLKKLFSKTDRPGYVCVRILPVNLKHSNTTFVGVDSITVFGYISI